ncbi:hypothetical protein [Qipengyuania sp.]|uniref:hypothetical protein n=1 Tax=Qipengyuania sp. TaxID=2004515 RepID=UPI0035C845B8
MSIAIVAFLAASFTVVAVLADSALRLMSVLDMRDGAGTSLRTAAPSRAVSITVATPAPRPVVRMPGTRQSGAAADTTPRAGPRRAAA